MTINLKMPHPEPDLKPRITVIGVGGAGGNAVNNMIENHLEGVEFVACNTDAQALAQSRAERKIQLGRNITQGLGAGSRPDVGRAAAEEAIDDILEHIQYSNMVFITAGMGGGTGTGAAPVVARASREQGILTVGVVTKPFQFEGLNRMRIAEEGMQELQHYVDTLIIIPNQNLFRIANEKTTFAQAFELADHVLHSGVRGVTDLMVMPGLINLDFADVRQVMSEMGKAMMGTGEAEGENRAVAAAEAAISNPLLDDVSMEGAKGVLINITGGLDMTLFEVDEAANRIRSEVDQDANIIFGSTFDENLEGKVRISVIATGIDAEVQAEHKPRTISLIHDNTRRAQQAPGFGLGGGLTGGRSAPAFRAPRGGEVRARDLDAEPEAQPAATDASRGGRSPADAPKSVAGDDAFLPAAPVEAPEDYGDPRPRRRPDPMAEAEMVNDGRRPEPEPRRKGPSLFERVTGTGRARMFRDSAETAAPRPAVSEPGFGAPAAPGRSETAARPGQPASHSAAQPAPLSAGQAPRSAMPEPRAEAPMQQPLGGLDPQPARDRNPEDDLLEIPAFLRRQAN